MANQPGANAELSEYKVCNQRFYAAASLFWQSFSIFLAAAWASAALVISRLPQDNLTLAFQVLVTVLGVGFFLAFVMFTLYLRRQIWREAVLCRRMNALENRLNFTGISNLTNMIDRWDELTEADRERVRGELGLTDNAWINKRVRPRGHLAVYWSIVVTSLVWVALVVVVWTIREI